MNTREATIKKASELGKEYERKYCACVPGTFRAIVDALRSEAGIELVTPEEEDRIHTAVLGLVGGTGGSALGNCGAVTGAGMAISLATGLGREAQEKDMLGAMSISAGNVKKFVVDKFKENFGSIICREICFARFGKAWDLSLEEPCREFLSMSRKHPNCQDGECTLAKGAAWAVEKILDMKGIP